MKHLNTLLLISSLWAISPQTLAAPLQLEDLSVDWSGRTQNTQGLMICDDSHYDGVRITVDGDPNSFIFYSPDFHSASPGSPKILREYMIRGPNGNIQTVLEIEDSNTTDIQFQQKSSRKTIVVHITDAC